MTAKTEAIANADAHLNNAGLPTSTELVKTLERMVANSGNVHESMCALVAEFHKPCDCALGTAREMLAKYREAA